MALLEIRSGPLVEPLLSDPKTSILTRFDPPLRFAKKGLKVAKMAQNDTFLDKLGLA
jgi:hypothetical protein